MKEIIARYRKDLGLTQEGLAQKLGVTNQAVSKWESGQSYPDITLLPMLADIFGIPIDALFGREPKTDGSAPALPWGDDGELRMVLYAGHRLLEAGAPAAKEFHFCYEGPALNVTSAFSVTCDAVSGNVTAGGDVSCDAVMGHLTAAGEVNCDDVYGNVQASGTVNCDDVSGSVTANGNVACDDVGGSIQAGGNVTCDCAEGDIRAEGDIHAGGDVYVDQWER